MSRRPAADERLAALEARVDQALARLAAALREQGHNRALADVCLDVRNVLAPKKGTPRR